MTAAAGRSIARRWLLPALLTLSTLYVSALLALSAWVFAPAALGWTPVVISSGSMTPLIRVGDVVVVDRHDGRTLDPSTVVTFREAGRLVTHRVVEVTDDGYITKGDANTGPDSTPLAADAIVGAGRILVPLVARPYIWALSGQTGQTVAWGLLTALALTISVSRPGVRRPADTPAPPPAPPPTDRAPATPDPASDLQPRPPVVLRPGAVWHATKPPFADPTEPTRARRRWPLTLLQRTTLTGVLTVVMLVGVPAFAALSGTTQATGSWTGNLPPPTDVQATAGCSNDTPHVDVTWTASPKADGYDIYRTTDPDSEWVFQDHVTGGDTEAWRDSPVEEGTYHYRLEATASSWTSEPSASDDATVSTLLPCL